MATILELAVEGAVVKLEPDLDPDELEERCIYALPKAIEDIDALAGAASLSGSEVAPLEQLYDLLSHFCSGGEMVMPDQFHELYNRSDGIWELKTRDLRLFGWFHLRDCFICTGVKDATFVKNGPPGFRISGSLYRGFGDEAVRMRRDLELDEPKHIMELHPENVVSNYAQR